MGDTYRTIWSKHGSGLKMETCIALNGHGTSKISSHFPDMSYTLKWWDFVHHPSYLHPLRYKLGGFFSWPNFATGCLVDVACCQWMKKNVIAPNFPSPYTCVKSKEKLEYLCRCWCLLVSNDLIHNEINDGIYILEWTCIKVQRCYKDPWLLLFFTTTR